MSKFEDPIERLFSQSRDKGLRRQIQELDLGFKIAAALVVLVVLGEVYLRYFDN